MTNPNQEALELLSKARVALSTWSAQIRGTSEEILSILQDYADDMAASAERVEAFLKENNPDYKRVVNDGTGRTAQQVKEYADKFGKNPPNVPTSDPYVRKFEELGGHYEYEEGN